MHRRLEKYYENPVIRHYVRVVTFVILGMFMGAMLMIFALHTFRNSEPQLIGTTDAPPSTHALSESMPTRLVIPKINLTASFGAPLGLNADQSSEVPDSYEEVGWYKYGPTPGEIGPSVILGHVDSKTGPAVFYSLGQLEVGDEVVVEREDGMNAVFEVIGLKRYAQKDFPTGEVYGDIDHAGLRLVTCTGVYDRGEKRYSHNLVVYAKLVEIDEPETSAVLEDILY